jgi:hypothetical protein
MKVAQHEVLGWRLERVSRPGRDDRLAACARKAVCETERQTFLSSLPGRTSLFESFPSTSYWATFITSLAGRNPHHRRITQQ